MPKSYLITLDQTDLQSIIFQTVDRAIKINRITAGFNNTLDKGFEDTETEKNTSIKKTSNHKKEVCNG